MINNLVKDILDLAEGRKLPSTISHNVGASFTKWFEDREPRKEKTLYFSEVGDPCLRRLWYKVNTPTAAEELPGHTRIKFLYGDMLEDLVLRLSEAAGHTVAGEQQKVKYEVGNGWTISGRIDAVIDGVVVDVKSVTKFSEDKFKEGLVNDPFGYYSQLNGYATALDSSDAGFLTIQKELGHISYYPINVDKRHFVDQVEHAIDAVERKDNDLPVIPAIPQSATSKNKKLDTTCSYCAYKKQCYPNLRTFAYSNGPVFLTEVVDLPKVMEIK